MDIEKEYSCLEQNKRVFQRCIEVDENFQEALQAYCDDLYRIIKCSAHSYITSVDINYNEVKIFGKTEICITYYDEASNLCYADFDEEFTRSVEADGLSDSAFATAIASDKYCSFRVINQRRVDVHCSCSVNVAVYDKQSCPCVTSCEGSKLKMEIVNTADIIGSCISKVEFDEEVTVPASSLKRIINASGYVTLDETKIIKDKSLIKMNVSVSVLYCTEDSSDKLQRYEYSFPASKIIDINGVNDDSFSVSSADIGCLFFKIKSTAGNDSSVIQLYGDIVVNSLFVAETERKIITDGYVLKHKSECDYSCCLCACNGKYINEEKQQVVSFDFNNEISEIYDASVVLTDVCIKNNKVCAKATAVVVCSNQGGDIASFSAVSDIELCPVSCDSGEIGVSLKSFDYNMLSDGRIDMRISYLLSGYLFDEKSINVLSEITAEDEEIKNPALTVYFGKKDELIWSIAKCFSSDIDMIIKENELTSDALDSNKILIIPGI